MGRYKGRYQVIGPPGTGKTTWLGAQVAHCVADGAEVCVSSLTRAAAIEVVRKQPPIPRDQIATLHAHAYRAIGKPRLYLDEIADWNEKQPFMRMRDAKSEDRTVDDLSAVRRIDDYPGDDLYEAVDLRRHQCVPRELWTELERDFYDDWTKWKQETEVIDFTDMIERALADTVSPECSPNVLFADEAQDLSSLEYSLLCHWGESCDALMITGDPNQALYLWRGANPKLFNDPDVPEDHRQVLQKSYRVPRAVHAASAEWIKGLSDYTPIEYRPRDFDGVAARFYDGTSQSPWAVVQAAKEVAASGRTAMIIASCGYLLQATIRILREQGLPFANPWRIRRGDWNPLRYRKKATTMPQRLLSFLKPTMHERIESSWTGGEAIGEAMGGPWTFAELAQWTELLLSDQCLVHGAKKRIKDAAKETPNDCVTPQYLRSTMKDETYSIAVLMIAGDIQLRQATDWLRQNALASKQASMTYPLNVIEQSGADALLEKPSIFIGTAHSLKGSESDVVFLYPEISNAAAEHAMRYGSDDLIRTFYVAMTRAREELYVCMKCDSRAVEIEL